MRRHLTRKAALAGVLSAAVLGGGMAGTATAAPRGCPAHSVSSGPMYWEYRGTIQVGPGYYQRSYREYYNSRFLRWTYCRA